MAVFNSNNPGFKDDVERLQTVLNQYGFDVGSVDGAFGPNTFNQSTFAVLAFEQGRLTHSQMQEINEATRPILEAIRDDYEGFQGFMASNDGLIEFSDVSRLPGFTDFVEEEIAVKPGLESVPQYSTVDVAEPDQPIIDDAGVEVAGDGLSFSGILCDDIMTLQGFLGIPEDQQAPVIGPKTIDGIHGKLEDTFGEGWSEALSSMKSDATHGSQEWGQFTEAHPEVSMLLQQLDYVEDPRYQGEGGPSIFDSLIPNAPVSGSDSPSLQSSAPGISVDCDSNSVGTCEVVTGQNDFGAFKL